MAAVPQAQEAFWLHPGNCKLASLYATLSKAFRGNVLHYHTADHYIYSWQIGRLLRPEGNGSCVCPSSCFQWGICEHNPLTESAALCSGCLTMITCSFGNGNLSHPLYAFCLSASKPVSKSRTVAFTSSCYTDPADRHTP